MARAGPSKSGISAAHTKARRKQGRGHIPGPHRGARHLRDHDSHRAYASEFPSRELLVGLGQGPISKDLIATDSAPKITITEATTERYYFIELYCTVHRIGICYQFNTAYFIN